MRLRLGWFLSYVLPSAAFGSPPSRLRAKPISTSTSAIHSCAKYRWPCPFSRTMGGAAREDENSRKAADLLAGSLDFTGYFQDSRPRRVSFDPQKSGVSAAEINFQTGQSSAPSCSSPGFRTNGRHRVHGDAPVRYVRGRQALGKRYTGNVSEIAEDDPAFLLGGGLLPYG